MQYVLQVDATNYWDGVKSKVFIDPLAGKSYDPLGLYCDIVCVNDILSQSW